MTSGSNLSSDPSTLWLVLRIRTGVTHPGRPFVFPRRICVLCAYRPRQRWRRSLGCFRVILLAACRLGGKWIVIISWYVFVCWFLCDSSADVIRIYLFVHFFFSATLQRLRAVAFPPPQTDIRITLYNLRTSRPPSPQLSPDLAS